MNMARAERRGSVDDLLIKSLGGLLVFRKVPGTFRKEAEKC